MNTEHEEPFREDGTAADARQELPADVPETPEAAPSGEEDFETLIRGRYRKEFDSRVQRIVKDRLKNVRPAQPQALTDGEKEALLREFPDADAGNPALLRMVADGIEPGTAWAALHRRELSEALARSVREQTRLELADTVRLNAARPAENGLNEAAPARLSADVPFTAEQRRALRERVRRGEKIHF